MFIDIDGSCTTFAMFSKHEPDVHCDRKYNRSVYAMYAALLCGWNDEPTLMNDTAMLS